MLSDKRKVWKSNIPLLKKGSTGKVRVNSLFSHLQCLTLIEKKASFSILSGSPRDRWATHADCLNSSRFAGKRVWGRFFFPFVCSIWCSKHSSQFPHSDCSPAVEYSGLEYVERLVFFRVWNLVWRSKIHGFFCELLLLLLLEELNDAWNLMGFAREDAKKPAQ